MNVRRAARARVDSSHRAAIKRGVGAALIALGAVGAGPSAEALHAVAAERALGGRCGGPGCADERYLYGGLSGIAISHAAFGAGSALLIDGDKAPTQPGANRRRGVVLEIVGGVLTTAGGSILLGATPFINRSEGYEHFPTLLAVGGAAVAAVGIPLVGYGAYLRPPNRPAPPRIGMTPLVGPSGPGGILSLSGTF